MRPPGGRRSARRRHPRAAASGQAERGASVSESTPGARIIRNDADGVDRNVTEQKTQFSRGLGAQMLLRELAEAVARAFVRAERILVGVLRVGRDLLGDRTYLACQLVVVGRVAQELLDPRLRPVVRLQVGVEEQLAEQQADADVREGPEREDP